MPSRLRTIKAALAVLFLMFLLPTDADAQLVTFKATGSVRDVFGYNTAVQAAFAQRFPQGTTFEIVYTFDLSTVPSSPHSYPAITALTLRIGDYTAVQSVLPVLITINNDIELYAAIPGAAPCKPEGGHILGDEYRINPDLDSMSGPEAVLGFGSPRQVSLELQRACVAGTDLAAMLATGELSATPPDLGVQDPEASGLWASWHDGTGWADVYAPVESVTVVVTSNTGTGQEVVVNPAVILPNGTTSAISLTFDSVASSGDTTVTASTAGQPPPSGFKLTSPPVYYEIATTATFTGNVRVCLGWTEGQISNENHVRMFHNEAGQWRDITDPASIDTVNNKVCGAASSLSPFTLFEISYTFTGLFQPVDNPSTYNKVKAGSAVPVKFNLGGDRGLNIFAVGYPRVANLQCNTTAPQDDIEQTVAATANSLTYDAVSGQYTFVWKTDKAFAGSCRELQLKFDDGSSVRAAWFNLTK